MLVVVTVVVATVMVVAVVIVMVMVAVAAMVIKSHHKSSKLLTMLSPNHLDTSDVIKTNFGEVQLQNISARPVPTPKKNSRRKGHQMSSEAIES